MSDKTGGALQEEVQTLKTLRDELRVQLHLAKSEAKERFEGAEKSWQDLEGKMKLIGRESKDAAGEVGEAARLLLDEIREAYQHIRKLV